MIKCVAIDDEPIALEILREYCRRTGDIELECFASPEAGGDYIRAKRPDIVFLDIEMNSHIGGIELAKTLPRECCIIFTTAYAQYALDGFEVDAVDFLHKPIFFERFERAIEKARLWLNGRSATAPRQGTLMLKSEYKNVLVNIADIEYVEAMDNYIRLHRRRQPGIMSQMTMKEIEGLLPAASFVRVHRSFIVALDAIVSFSNRQIYLADRKDPIPVGRKYNERFNNIYNKIKQK